jgi:hypothetical protein
MRRFIPLILDTASIAALAVWLGGLAACWMVLRPAAYAMPVESMRAAQQVFAESLRRMGGIIEVSGLVLAAIQWVLRRRYQRDRPLYIADGARTLILFIALFCAEYSRYVLIPALMKTDAPAVVTILAALAVAQALLLIGYVGVTGWLQMPRSPAVARAAKPPGAVPLRPQQAKPSPARRQK